MHACYSFGVGMRFCVSGAAPVHVQLDPSTAHFPSTADLSIEHAMDNATLNV